MENLIYTIPELTRIVRVVGYHVPMKAKFTFIQESIAEMTLLVSVWARISNFLHITKSVILVYLLCTDLILKMNKYWKVIIM